MKPAPNTATALFLAALACMAFGFVPLVVVASEVGLEFAWLVASNATSLDLTMDIAPYLTDAANQAFGDWAGLYRADGQYNVRLFIAQCACTLLWCAYLKWAKRRTS